MIVVSSLLYTAVLVITQLILSTTQSTLHPLATQLEQDMEWLLLVEILTYVQIYQSRIFFNIVLFNVFFFQIIWNVLSS